MGHPSPDSEEIRRLLQQVRAGDASALDRLLALHRGYLHRVVELRLEPRLRARLDASDVVQEAQLQASRRIADYLEREPMPFRLWLRKTTCECLLTLRRHHAEAECRAVDRELPLPEDSSLLLAQQLLAGNASPGRQLLAQERVRQVRQALAGLAETDREIILLRNFEELSNQETAQILGLEPAAASKRYARALLRLRHQFAQVGLTGSQP
jgi:RNA polymerase sigma-70 factor (ECF subfamily)